MDPDQAEVELNKRQETADKELQTALNTIYKKHVSELNENDREFLYARRSVIGRDKREEYKEVFKQVEAAHDEKLKKEAEEAKHGRPPVEEKFDGQEDPHAETPQEGDEDEDGEDEEVG